MKTIVLLSGGVDSCVVLASAMKKGLDCLCLSFHYNQRHKIELEAAKEIAKYYNAKHKIITIDPTAFSLSSLVTKEEIPKNRTIEQITNSEIPNTYVPGRNTLFIAYAAIQAEIYEAKEIHVGANLLDFHAYPDCRPIYFEKFQQLLNVATKQAIEGNPPQLKTPLIEMSKQEIVNLGIELKAPLSLTFSCYDPIEKNTPCQQCDACKIRGEAFKNFHF